jgi:transposase InsO family protein
MVNEERANLPALLRRLLEPAQYTSICYAERLAEERAVRSVGSKGDSYDNAAAEALNSLYKRELIDPGKDWQGVDDVMLATMAAPNSSDVTTSGRSREPGALTDGPPGGGRPEPTALTQACRRLRAGRSARPKP